MIAQYAAAEDAALAAIEAEQAFSTSSDGQG